MVNNQPIIQTNAQLLFSTLILLITKNYFAYMLYKYNYKVLCFKNKDYKVRCGPLWIKKQLKTLTAMT